MRAEHKPRQAGLDSGQAGSRRLRLLVLSLTVLIAISLLSRLPAWSLLELRSFDYLSTFDDPRPPPGGPVIVAIDEPSLADINAQWPWPRSLHAELVTQLRAAGARVIGLDIIMAEPSTPGNDAAIAKAVGPDVVLAGDETLIETPQASQLIRATPLPALTDAGAVTGIASVDLSGDGIFRRIPGYEDGFAAMLAKASARPAATRRSPITRRSTLGICCRRVISRTASSSSGSACRMRLKSTRAASTPSPRLTRFTPASSSPALKSRRRFTTISATACRSRKRACRRSPPAS
jgi:hypothetical protein